MARGAVIYPIFEKCAELTVDKFWQDVFIGCSLGKFPQGIRYDSSRKTLIIRTSDMKKAQVLSAPQDPKLLYQMLIKLFREKLDWQSNKDLEQQREQLDKMKEKKTLDLDCEWKKIKNKTIREQFLMAFVIKLSEEHQLNDKEFKQLISTLHLGFLFKDLSSDGVEYEKGQVTGIDGLEFDSKSRTFYTIKETVGSHKLEKNISSGPFYQQLDKFIREYNAQRAKN